MNGVSDLLVVGLDARFARKVEGAWETQLALKEVSQSPGVGFGCHNTKTGRAKEILRH